MKVFIVVLVLVGILFAVSVIVGVEDEKTTKSEERNLKEGKSPGWVDWFKGFAESRKPKVKVTPEVIKVTTATGTLPVPAAPNKEKFRTLKLVWEKGGEVYVKLDTTPVPDGIDGLDKPQEVILANVKKMDEEDGKKKCKEASLMVFERGGTLTFTMWRPKAGTTPTGTIRVK